MSGGADALAGACASPVAKGCWRQRAKAAPPPPRATLPLIRTSEAASGTSSRKKRGLARAPHRSVISSRSRAHTPPPSPMARLLVMRTRPPRVTGYVLLMLSPPPQACAVARRRSESWMVRRTAPAVATFPPNSASLWAMSAPLTTPSTLPLRLSPPPAPRGVLLYSSVESSTASAVRPMSPPGTTPTSSVTDDTCAPGAEAEAWLCETTPSRTSREEQPRALSPPPTEALLRSRRAPSRGTSVNTLLIDTPPPYRPATLSCACRPPMWALRRNRRLSRDRPPPSRVASL
mmetsp:Transcript_41129/g.100908  ORF Transcript_41129/g.100908 Transcript_41129/m.100908 type:complete len:290 (-) Transcript_41129:3229-4098(-)